MYQKLSIIPLNPRKLLYLGTPLRTRHWLPLNQLSVISYQSVRRMVGDALTALRVRHLLYLGKPQDRSGSPPTHKGPIGGGRATTRI
ncbi:hypothetical protein [Scytonema sp. HK-05]|uniref:hypothetical protein n=1 Tax=Scytonema sp. HK-05 TaxID=1137095 RepID=UPI0011610138|nr:hypothetical protein [Scytonema sp. HK-05]